MNKLALFALLTLITTSSCSSPAKTQTQMKSNASFDNTRWKLTGLAGLDSLPGLRKDAFIQFNGTEGRYHGNAGCNLVNGSYTLEGNTLRFGPAAMTRMACPEAEMNVEMAFTKMLQEVDGFLITGEKLELRSGAKTVATFKALYL
jgi:heat shock protein HslJ